MLKHLPRHPIAAEQAPQPQTPETGQRQLLERPSLQESPAVAAKNDSQAAPFGCSHTDNSQNTCSPYNPTYYSIFPCAAGTPAPPIESKNKAAGILGLINWGGGG